MVSLIGGSLIPSGVYSKSAIDHMGLGLSGVQINPQNYCYVPKPGIKQLRNISMVYTQLFDESVVRGIQEASRLVKDVEKSFIYTLIDSIFIFRSIREYRSDEMKRMDARNASDMYIESYNPQMFKSHKTLSSLRNIASLRFTILLNKSKRFALSLRVGLCASAIIVAIGLILSVPAMLSTGVVLGGISIASLYYNKKKMDQILVKTLKELVANFIDEQGKPKLYSSEFYVDSNHN